jgi:hypothetical protein
MTDRDSRYTRAVTVAALAIPWTFPALYGRQPGAESLTESVAQEHQIARTATHVQAADLEFVTPGRPPSVNALRTMAALTGIWRDLDTTRCRPDVGEHAPGCPHQARYFTTSVSEVARRAYGRDSGNYREMAKAGMREMASHATQVLVFDRGTHRLIAEQVATVGEYARVDDRVRWALGASTHESLLAGGFTILPPEIVQQLSGSAFYVWQAILSHPALLKSGTVELALDGHLSLARLGLDRLNRPAKRRATLERAIADGNARQDKVTVQILERAHGGLKLRVTRRPKGAQIEDAGVPKSRTQSAQIEDAIPREIERPDVFKTSSLDVSDVLASLEDEGLRPSLENAPSLRSGNEAQAEADSITALLKDGRLPGWTESEAQWRRLCAIARRGQWYGCDPAEHVAMVEDRIRQQVDSFEAHTGGNDPLVNSEADVLADLFDHDDLWHSHRLEQAMKPLRPTLRVEVWHRLGAGDDLSNIAAGLGLLERRDPDTGAINRLEEWQ